METIRIRPFEPSDIEEYQRIHNDLDAASELLHPPMLNSEEARARATHRGSERLLVAEYPSGVVGFGTLRIFAGRRSHVGQVVLAIEPESGVQHAGATLLEALIDLAEHWYGLRRLELKVFASNTRAIELYERFGFEVEATHHQFALRDGDYATALSMARLMAGGDR